MAAQKSQCKIILLELISGCVGTPINKFQLKLQPGFEPFGFSVSRGTYPIAEFVFIVAVLKHQFWSCQDSDVNGATPNYNVDCSNEFHPFISLTILKLIAKNHRNRNLFQLVC